MWPQAGLGRGSWQGESLSCFMPALKPAEDRADQSAEREICGIAQVQGIASGDQASRHGNFRIGARTRAGTRDPLDSIKAGSEHHEATPGRLRRGRVCHSSVRQIERTRHPYQVK
jgi:hypothetical protein